MRVRSWTMLLWVTALVLGTTTTAGAEPGSVATVTSVQGSVTAGADSRGLGLRSPISSNEAVETKSDARLSLLVGNDAAVDLCGDTKLAFEDAGKAEIVRVDGGDLRAFVAPRAADARLEIHTPAAVAVILGTIVHTSVNAQTGATTFTSRDNDVLVRSSTAGVRGETTICCGESVTVEKGGKPGAKRKLDARQLAALGACYVGLADAAAASDRVAAERAALDRMAEADAGNAPLPPVGSELPDVQTTESPNPGDVCYPPDCGDTVTPSNNPNDPNTIPGTGTVVLPQGPPGTQP